ncbi:VPLPA-CTERM sorting domain-containing protein [Roseobacter sp. EG26]|uniref:VPLPA-CTERM sorting domain-containing protein n=1 Tax=Roseobacter sp. EG26 TaxID=3412477 RepID=UPI003CE44FE3
MTFKAFAFATALVALTATSSLAATVKLNVVGGQLLGARNVDVDGTLYDVKFVDGTCVEIFDGCDSVSDFAFQTFELATTAAISLSKTVFIDGPLGNFDSAPELTNGIEATKLSFIHIPFGLPSASRNESAETRVFANRDVADNFWLGLPLIDFDLTNNNGSTFARFTPSRITAVPLPAGGLLLIAGLFGLGAVRMGRNGRATR